MKISIVLPIFNEVENINILYEEILGALSASGYDFEVIFIDDGSTDGSQDLIRNLCAKNSNKCKGVFFRRNFGQTAAMAAGIDHAKGDVLVFMDSDLQNDPHDIPALMAKLNEGFDVVAGWRKNRMDKAFSRILPSKIANWVIRSVTGVKVHDMGCSLKAFRIEIIRDVRLYGEMHRFIPVFADAAGGRVTEIVVNHRPRIHGSSKYGIDRTLRVILDLITVKFLLSYLRKPMHFFGGVGISLIALALGTLTSLLYFKLANGESMVRSPLLLLSAILFLLSIMSVLMGLLAEMQTRTYYESQKLPINRVKEVV